ncbi:MAG: hypothetical protein R3F50_08965 [Gammaproteobacteria bacterium]
MTDQKVKVLFINGIRDNGTVDVSGVNLLGRIIFSTSGSCHVASYVPSERINVSHFILDHRRQQRINVNYILSHDVVFCEISDPDSHANALNKAQKVYNALYDKIPWINNPYKVLNTRREVVPGLLGDIAGVIAPRTLRLKPSSLADIKSTIEDSGFSLPVLLRPAGSHGGDDLVLIEHLSALDDLDLHRYKEAYLTEFFDFSSNGIYSKYRFAVVAGEPHIRHRLSRDHWLIHRDARAFTASVPELRQAEADAITQFKDQLKPKVQKIIHEIYQRIGLDYFGIDCAIKDDKLILFEVNANMNIMPNNQASPNIWEEAIDGIRNSIVENLIIPRATSKV